MVRFMCKMTLSFYLEKVVPAGRVAKNPGKWHKGQIVAWLNNAADLKFHISLPLGGKASGGKSSRSFLHWVQRLGHILRECIHIL